MLNIVRRPLASSCTATIDVVLQLLYNTRLTTVKKLLS